MNHNFDPVWDEWYSEGKFNRYPWDTVVTFVFRHAPKNKKREEIKILEIGCGSAPNLWFAAKEGFNVTGIDGSEQAIEFARSRFKHENLKGRFIVRDFSQLLPFSDNEFDLVIDRGSLVCVDWDSHKNIFREIERVIKPCGFFHYNGYSDDSTSYIASTDSNDKLVHSITNGSLQGVGQLAFFSSREIKELFAPEKWRISSWKKKNEHDINPSTGNTLIHSEWIVIAQNKKEI